MINVTADISVEELEALKVEKSTHYRFTPDGAEDSIVDQVKKLEEIVGMVGTLEFGKGKKNFTPLSEEVIEKAEAKPKKEKKEETLEEKAKREELEIARAQRREKLALIDSMLVPVGFEACPTKDKYREAKGEGADINLAEFEYNTEDIVNAIVESGLEPIKADEDGNEVEDEAKRRFRIMKNIQARKFNLVKAEKVAGYKIREREITAKSIPPEKIVAFFRDTDCIAKLTNEQKTEILERLG